MDRGRPAARTSPMRRRWRRCSRGRWRSTATVRSGSCRTTRYSSTASRQAAAAVPAAVRGAVRRGPRTAAHFRADRRRKPKFPYHLPGRSRARSARWAATTTTRSTTAGRWANGKATRWWSTPAGSTRTSGSRTAGCRTPTSCKLIERFTRTDFDTLKYEVTVDDPGAYTRPWSASWTLRWVAGRGICQCICARTTDREDRFMQTEERHESVHTSVA